MPFCPVCRRGDEFRALGAPTDAGDDADPEASGPASGASEARTVANGRPKSGKARPSSGARTSRPQLLRASAPTVVPLVGRSTAFISHAWLFETIDVIDALENEIQRGSLRTSDYFWLDFFSVNQVNDDFVARTTFGIKREKDFWSGAFKEAILSIGRTVAVLQPWQKPFPLTRAWCLWEYATSAYAGYLSFALNPREVRRSSPLTVAQCVASIAVGRRFPILSFLGNRSPILPLLTLTGCQPTEHVAGGRTQVCRSGHVRGSGEHQSQ